MVTIERAMMQFEAMPCVVDASGRTEIFRLGRNQDGDILFFGIDRAGCFAVPRDAVQARLDINQYPDLTALIETA